MVLCPSPGPPRSGPSPRLRPPLRLARPRLLRRLLQGVLWLRQPLHHLRKACHRLPSPDARCDHAVDSVAHAVSSARARICIIGVPRACMPACSPRRHRERRDATAQRAPGNRSSAGQPKRGSPQAGRPCAHRPCRPYVGFSPAHVQLQFPGVPPPNPAAGHCRLCMALHSSQKPAFSVLSAKGYLQGSTRCGFA